MCKGGVAKHFTEYLTEILLNIENGVWQIKMKFWGGVAYLCLRSHIILKDNIN